MKSVRISGFAAVWCCGDADTWRLSCVVVASRSLGVVGCVVLGNVPVCYPGLTGLYCWCCLWCGHCACILLPGFGGLCCSWHRACICHCSFTNTNQSFNHKMVSLHVSWRQCWSCLQMNFGVSVYIMHHLILMELLLLITINTFLMCRVPLWYMCEADNAIHSVLYVHFPFLFCARDDLFPQIWADFSLTPRVIFPLNPGVIFSLSSWVIFAFTPTLVFSSDLLWSFPITLAWSCALCVHASVDLFP